MEMIPTAVYQANPLLPLADRRMVYAPFMPAETVGAYLDRMGLMAYSGDVVVTLNGYDLTANDCDVVVPKQGDRIIVQAVMQGGDGSNPLMLVAMIAVMIYAPQLGALAYESAVGGTALFTSAGSIIAQQMAVMAGMMLVSSMFAPPKPKTDIAAGTQYSLSGGQNQARPYSPMLVVFGQFRLSPDYGSKPYTVAWESSAQNLYEQVLYQIFHFGLSDLKMSAPMLGDSPLSNFKEVETQYSASREFRDSAGKLVRMPYQITLCPNNVDTQAPAFTLTKAAGVVTYTSSPATNRLHFEMGVMNYRMSKIGNALGQETVFQIKYRRTHTVAGVALTAPEDWQYVHSTQVRGRWEAGYTDESYESAQWVIVAIGSNDAADHREGDVHSTLPVAAQGEMPATTRPVVWHWNAEYWGAGVSNWINTGTPNDMVPVPRYYDSGAIPGGTYEIQMQRQTADGADETKDQLIINQIRSFQTYSAATDGEVRLAVKMKANEALTGNVPKFSMLASARCQVWNGAAWATAETSNPAWWFLHFARGRQVREYDQKRKQWSSPASFRRLYGAFLADSRIDIDSIKAWALWCDSKNLKLNGVLDTQRSVADVLTMIARVGRASPTWASGKLGVVWDAADQPVVAMFGMGNIKRGSVSVAYAAEAAPDEIIVAYTDPTTWERAEVRAVMPGTTNPARSITLDLWGCTDKDQAQREANLILAEQVYRRRTVTFSTDAEGMVVTRGDVIQIAHDLPAWGYSGRLVSAATSVRLLGGDANLLTVDKTMGLIAGRQYFGNLRTADGTVYAFTVVPAVTAAYTVLDATWKNDPPALADLTQDCIWMMDAMAGTPGKRCKVIGVKPSDNGVTITAVDDDPAYYLSEYRAPTLNPLRESSLISQTGPALTSLTAQNIKVDASTYDVRVAWRLRNAVGARISYTVRRLLLRSGNTIPSWAQIRSVSVANYEGSAMTINGLRKGDNIQLSARPIPFVMLANDTLTTATLNKSAA